MKSISQLVAERNTLDATIAERLAAAAAKAEAKAAADQLKKWVYFFDGVLLKTKHVDPEKAPSDSYGYLDKLSENSYALRSFNGFEDDLRSR